MTEGEWTFVREGETYVIIKTLNDGRILLEARYAKDYLSFEVFKTYIKDNLVSQDGGITYTGTLGDVIHFPTLYDLYVNGEH